MCVLGRINSAYSTRAVVFSPMNSGAPSRTLFRDDRSLSRPGMRFNLGHADELASLTRFNSVKFSGHLWRFLILYGL